MSTAAETSGDRRRIIDQPARYSRNGLDFFIEPDWSVDLLLDAEPFYGRCYDPACGSGNIVRRCLARGLDAYGSDIADRGFGTGGCDFLSAPLTEELPANIIFNPPYVLAQQFIEHALKLATHKVAALVQSKFPYSQRRHALFSQHPPARIYFLSTRPSMPPGEGLLDGTIKAKGGKLDYCWLVWARDHRGATTAHWLKRGAA